MINLQSYTERLEVSIQNLKNRFEYLIEIV